MYINIDLIRRRHKFTDTLYKPRYINGKWLIHSDDRNRLKEKLKSMCYDIDFMLFINGYKHRVLCRDTDSTNNLTITIYNIRVNPSYDSFIGSDRHSDD